MELLVDNLCFRCKDCKYFLNEELFCIGCNQRIKGKVRDFLLDFYQKFKYCKGLDENILHVTPSHIADINYTTGCFQCEETLPSTLGIFLQIDNDSIPPVLDIPRTLSKIFNLKITIFLKKGEIISVESETVDNSEEDYD